ncbi:class I SAM-dependent methyltransferase [Cytobacillus oceanisediminis]|uniref:Methyltransferase family protein n=1 Tax=Cytobacillus oceanisediminis TaxID=665099 RepID=A0A562K1H7_9BACI|nr:class I SAM-dependent methyltransferase [Cytobacillus oceanisediminis]TWH89289.1 methyltransferase family protein [Cytobacillus oceanisediminis]
MLENTGERIIPEELPITNGMLLEHLARYYFSLYYAKGRVLDIACGTGYGSKIMAKSKKEEINEIIAVDIDEETLKYARQNHYHPHVKYVKADAADEKLPDDLGLFDVITSFETIEHLETEEAFLDNLFKMLKPGGILILSTPFGAGRGKPTREPFHIHQLTEEEFIELFEPYGDTEFYYQRSVLIEPKREGKHYPIGIAVCRKR